MSNNSEPKSLVKTFLVLVCSVALACSASAAKNENKSKKAPPPKRQAQPTQHATAARGPNRPTPKHYEAASRTANYQNTKGPQRVYGQSYQSSSKPKKTKGSQQTAAQSGQAVGVRSQKVKASQQAAAGGRYTTSATYSKKTKQWKGNTASAAVIKSNAKTYRAQHFNLASNTRPTRFASVKFQQNRRIWGSQNWQGKNYWAFRNYRPAWHDRIWWGHHYNRIVFVYGGWYYWNSGWWYPAWGYAPNAYYAYDGPIYAYNNLPPDQVIANVQGALQQQGYYQSDVDGLLGPITREAIANYQRDHRLYVTSAIDRPTLDSLGMA